mgnify:CR=1 FL=1
MEALSVREYRNNLAASFTKADNGEQVLIRRKKKSNQESVLPSKAVRILTLISIVYDVHN